MNELFPNGVAAKIEIVLMQDGNIACKYSGPGRDAFNMMLARASQDMLPRFLEAESQKVVAPPPGASLALGR